MNITLPVIFYPLNIHSYLMGELDEFHPPEVAVYQTYLRGVFENAKSKFDTKPNCIGTIGLNTEDTFVLIDTDHLVTLYAFSRWCF